MGRGTARPDCSLEDCDQPHYGLGYCRKHWRRFKKHGHVEATRAEPHAPFKNADGYVMIWAPDHPDSYKPTNRIPEHRLVMEGLLGRRLLPGENVHHKNGVRDDNRPENLELWITQQPKGQRVEDVLSWAHEIIERYET